MKLAFGQHQRQRQLLPVGGREDVLQVAETAASAFNDQPEESVQVVGLQGRYLIRHAAVFGKVMGGAQNRPVSVYILEALAQLGHHLHELLRLHAAQVGFAEAGGHGAHLLGNGSVEIRQIVVAAAGVDHHQRIALGGKIVADFTHLGIIILEINVDQSARTGGHLVHQTAGLSEIHVFSILGDLRAALEVQLSLVVDLVKDGAQEHLHCRRAAQTAAAAHGGGNHRVEAAHAQARFLQTVGHAAHQRRRGAFFRFVHAQIIQRKRQGGVSLAVDVHDAVGTRADGGQRVQVDGSGQYLAPVMVGVIAADFGASRRADHGDGAFIADKLFMPLEQARIPRALGHQHPASLAVKVGQTFHDLGCFEFTDHLRVPVHKPSILLW